MKKYCFTRCFKTKMQHFWEWSVNAIAFVSVLLLIVLGLWLGLTLLGLMAQAIYVTINGNLIGWEVEILDSGALTLLFLIVATAVGFVISVTLQALWNMSIATYKGVRHVSMAAIGREKFECKIFEECKG